MDNSLNNDYINNAIEELVNFLGIRETISAEKIKVPYTHQDVKECIKNIACCLGLPIEVNLSYVSKNYKPDPKNNFTSQHLVKTDYRGRGSEGIVAQVSIPGNLPLYGTYGFKNFPINIKVSENCIEYPRVFMAIMAHELSHIVLHSLLHKNKDNEFYTDLTAMILGFSDIIKYGRKITEVEHGWDTKTTKTTTYGYLSDKQFDYTFNKINDLLEKYKKLKKEALKRIEKFREKISICRKTVSRFEKYLKNIDKYHNKNFNQDDGQRIILMHQIGYTDELSKTTKEFKEKLDAFYKLVKEATFYSNSYSVGIENFKTSLNKLFEKLIANLNFLSNDINILKKYTSPFDKIKICLSCL